MFQSYHTNTNVLFQARTMISKIKESADYDQPSDFDTTKFKEVGNLAKGFSPRFVKNMTNVDFGSLLGSGDLKDIDFAGNVGGYLIHINSERRECY